ncbi:hypothetical protein M0D68_01320 [Paraburkholderia sp. SEWSISQ10-3 4]|nr:hypothetical protein [Paraburkholderia aspalathi]MDN7169492.1 hypothetical protein [Paraburkholderia sp. SEWSISQ10-3 4]MDQ6499131.1 hypothetical protein [Paraburkholderia aspalathi]
MQQMKTGALVIGALLLSLGSAVTLAQHTDLSPADTSQIDARAKQFYALSHPDASCVFSKVDDSGNPTDPRVRSKAFRDRSYTRIFKPIFSSSLFERMKQSCVLAGNANGMLDIRVWDSEIDTHRVPIPLQGKRQPDGEMQLCEAVEPVSFGDSSTVPAVSPSHPIACPVALKISGTEASGEWRDSKHVLPIALHQISSLDDTGLDTPRVVGAVEIPMWHHTKDHLLLGVYQSSKDCSLSMVRLRLINIKTGQIDRDLKFDCGTGIVATPIYANVYRAENPHHVTVISQGGYHGMGDDKDVAVEP